MVKGKAVVSFALVFLCLLASSAVYLQPVKAQFQGDIIINADGSVTPLSAPIQKTGNTYALTGNINGSITIVKNDTILNGNAHSVYMPLMGAPSGSVITLDNVSNVTVTNLTVSGRVFGINVEGTGNLVEDNNVTECGTIEFMNGADNGGIFVGAGSFNNITNNFLENNLNGLAFADTSNNRVVGNNVIGGPNYWDGVSGGIYFEDASNNTVYYNNFENNFGGQAQSYNSINLWDNGFPAGGNYWGQPTGQEIANTGISNTSYVIDSQNIDHFPLIAPFNSTFLANYEQEIIPPTVSIMSPLNETYSDSNVTLAYATDRACNWVGYSLDGQSNVTVDGNTTLTHIAYGSHSIAVYANSTFGIIGAKTVDFSVVKPETFTIIVAVFIVVIALVVTVSLFVLRQNSHRKNANLKQ